MRTRTYMYVVALMLCLLSMSCGYGSMAQTGPNSWDMTMRSGVQSHYYSYSGPCRTSLFTDTDD